MIELFETVKGVQVSTGRHFATGRDVVAALVNEYGVKYANLLNADNPYPLYDRNAPNGRTTVFQDRSYQWYPAVKGDPDMAVIECTKGEFIDHLRQAFEDLYWTTDGREVIDGLVRQANEHRGVFEGHSAYLDCDFIAYPDEPV